MSRLERFTYRVLEINAFILLIL